MKKVFISFSSKNQQLAEKFLEFLQLGMGLRRRDVFCTAFPEKLQTGENFIETIRQQMQECDTVILSLQPNIYRARSVWWKWELRGLCASSISHY